MGFCTMWHSRAPWSSLSISWPDAETQAAFKLCVCGGAVTTKRPGTEGMQKLVAASTLEHSNDEYISDWIDYGN